MISIIIPVYNANKYLVKCIESILAQSFQKFEIILIDNGSTDGSAKICDAYAAKYDNIKVIHRKNSDSSSCRNAGLEICSGKYITFIDSNHTIHANYLQTLRDLVLDNSADISICNCLLTNEENITKEEITPNIELLSKEESLSKIYTDKYANMVVIYGKLYKKDIFKNLKFPIGKIYEDEYMIHKILFEADKVVYTDATLLYCKNTENTSKSNKFDEKHLHFIEAIEDRLSFCLKHDLSFLIPKVEDQYAYELMYNFYNVKSSNIKYKKQICKEIKLKLFNIDSKHLTTKRKILIDLFRISPSLSRPLLK